MRAYLQQRRGEFPHITYYNAWLGFQELGYETVLLDEAAFGGLKVSHEEIVVGEIPIVLAALAAAGIAYRPLSYIPEELRRFANRKIWTATLGEVRQSVAAGASLFAKPLEGTWRSFKGQVLRSYRDLIRTAGLDASIPLWCSELVDFVSEYRVFVTEREIVGIKHYLGDFRVSVDWSTVDAVMANYGRMPSGFAIDFGVTRAGETLIVEQNDGFSLGCYGLHPVTYARLLEARWTELMGQEGAE